MLVYFCSFIHVHPDDSHFPLHPQQIRDEASRRCAWHQSEGLVASEEQKGISTVCLGSSISKVPLKAAV